MRSAVALMLLLLVNVATPQCISTDDHRELPSVPDLSHINPFGLELLKHIHPSGSTENFFFSPYSIWNALLLAYFGATGNTQKELEVALHLTNKSDTLATYKSLKNLNLKRESSGKGYDLDLANRIYVDDNITLKECVSQLFADELRTLDFEDALGTAATINSFVNQTTRGKIPELVRPSHVAGASAVPVNAVYFNGSWLKVFDEKYTSLKDFYVTPTTTEKVDMMIQRDQFKYYESKKLQATLLELPYVGEVVSMFILSPDPSSDTPLDSLIQRLDADLLREELSLVSYGMATVSIPKFKMEKAISYKLVQALGKLGIVDVFTPAGVLTGYDPAGRVQLPGGILHKAVVEVNEEGTEAAAATVFENYSSFPGVDILLDRPFLFFIQDKLTNTVLFMGVYRKP